MPWLVDELAGAAFGPWGLAVAAGIGVGVLDGKRLGPTLAGAATGAASGVAGGAGGSRGSGRGWGLGVGRRARGRVGIRPEIDCLQVCLVCPPGGATSTRRRTPSGSRAV